MDNYLFNLLEKSQNHNTSDVKEDLYKYFKTIIDNISKKASFEFINSDLTIKLLEIVNKINLKKYNTDCAIKSFIIRSLVNERTDILKKINREPKKCPLNLEMLNNSCYYLQSYLDLEDLFSKLTKKQEEIMYLEFLHGYKQAEIAIKLGSSAPAIGQCRERALTNIRKILERDFIKA